MTTLPLASTTDPAAADSAAADSAASDSAAAETATGTDAAGAPHECQCGHAEADGYPELDGRLVPHSIRHAVIFGALDSIPVGGGFVLIAPHDPLPLLAQLEERAPGAFTVSYLTRGPDEWKLQFVR